MLWREIEIGQKQLFQAVQKELPKVIHFQKFLKIGNNSARVLLLVKFHVLIVLMFFRKFPEHLDIFLEINIFSAKGDILLMPHICFYEVHIS